MPEGHSIFRYAAEHHGLFAGRVVKASSPQGRFARGAARLSGRRLLDVEAHGKHLFYRWERSETLHIHLGLYGRYWTHTGEAPPASPNTRLALSANGTTLYLTGPTVCELIEPSREETVRARLGPDPLQARKRDHSAAQLADKLRRRSIPIGAAIVDQSVMAGLGNIYRAEVLFLTGIHPETPAREISFEEIDSIWATSKRLLRRGVAEGKITTVPRRGHRGNTEDRVYVYKRDRFPCRLCEGPISTGTMADRSIWWCATCQPRMR